VRWRQIGLRADDGVLVSYPKSGSTWLRFLLATALADDEVDFDSVRRLVPPVGRHHRAPVLLGGRGRLTRTHEPLARLAAPAGGRVVYLVRDGLAVAASYLRHARAEGRLRGAADDFVDAFVAGVVDGYGPWTEHALGAASFAREDRFPLLVVRYEDLRFDTAGELRKVLRFLGGEVDTARVDASVQANTKAAMRAKEESSAFMRRRFGPGSAFVTEDRPSPDPFPFSPAARNRLETALAPARRAFGYGDPDPRDGRS
jgi:Sulfotransferase domain